MKYIPLISKFTEGIVVSAHKMNKSIMVAVPILRHFPKYKRWVFKTSKLMVHDEKEICDVGDKVRIQQTSKFTDNKSHKVAEIIRKEPGSGFVNQHPEYMVTREATREKERMDAKGVKNYKEWYTLPSDMEEEKKEKRTYGTKKTEKLRCDHEQRTQSSDNQTSSKCKFRATSHKTPGKKC